MELIFTDKQLNNMSREDLISLMKIVQEQTKKKDTEIQLLKDKQKELEFLNAMLSDRLTLAQRGNSLVHPVKSMPKAMNR